MTQEDKDIMFRELCARLPYGVCVQNITEGRENIKGDLLSVSRYQPKSVIVLTDPASGHQEYSPVEDVRMYLRPMSSMTYEEHRECRRARVNFNITGDLAAFLSYVYSSHIDFDGLIENGLALEAPEGMYK